MTPLVTAIMLTTYPNRAGMMNDALMSYVAQTYPRMQLVVVNDGDPLMRGRADVDVVMVPPGLSIGAKRNAGVAAARGDWVATWDDDDYSFPERIETQVRELDADPHRTRALFHRSRSMWVSGPDLVVRGLLANHPCYPTVLMHRQTILDLGGFPDLSYLEDMEVFLRLAFRGERGIRSSGEPFYVHRRHATNVSSVHSQQDEDQAIRASDRGDPRIASVNARIQQLLAVRHEPILVTA